MRQHDTHAASSRRRFLKNSLIASAGLAAAAGTVSRPVLGATSRPKIKITDLKCAILGTSPVVRITTSQGISGYGEAEERKSYLKPDRKSVV